MRVCVIISLLQHGMRHFASSHLHLHILHLVAVTAAAVIACFASSDGTSQTDSSENENVMSQLDAQLVRVCVSVTPLPHTCVHI